MAMLSSSSVNSYPYQFVNEWIVVQIFHPNQVLVICDLILEIFFDCIWL
jgi:hypothetical protein